MHKQGTLTNGMVSNFDTSEHKLTHIKSHCKIFGGYQTNFFGYGIVTIEMFEKKMFQIMCHMMGCNDSSG